MKKTAKRLLALGVVCCAHVSLAEGALSAVGTDWFERIVERRVAVSDTKAFTSASAPISCVDPDRGLIYTPYMASRTGYGECHDVIVLAEIPVVQPHRAVSHVVAEKGRMLDCFAIRLSPTCIRTFFLRDVEHYLYRDFNPRTQTFGPEKPVKCRFEGETDRATILTPTRLEAYLQQKGMTGYKIDNDPNEHLIVTAKPVWDGNGFYGAVTTGYSQPVIFRCDDGETFVFRGVVPKCCGYECQLAKVKGTMYALLRAADDANFWLSTDDGRTFVAAPKPLSMSSTRPQLLNCGDRLLIGYSERGVKPNLIAEGRNNLRLLLGEGPDLSTYRQVLAVDWKYGIVYYDIIDYKGVYYMIWSDGELFHDKPNGRDAKDVLFFSRIGELN